MARVPDFLLWIVLLNRNQTKSYQLASIFGFKRHLSSIIEILVIGLSVATLSR